MPLSRPGMNN